MAKAIFYQKPGMIDYKNATEAAIEANTIIVLGSRIGVAGCSIAVGEIGTLHVEGIFKMPKTGGAINAGAEVYFDGSGITGTSGEGTTKAGFAAAAAAANDTEVLVALNA